MQFLTSLFGGSENSILTYIFALVAVLALIVIALWLMKLMFKATGTVGRARNRRLSVVDSMALDQKRQLMIIRRDNVEHLILTGGPQDLVVESGIPVDTQAPRNPTARRGQPQPVQAAPEPAAPQRAPAPQCAPVANPTAPQAVEQADRPMSPLDRLRDLGRPAAQRKPTSLRHTGLMRPVSRMEPSLIPANTDNSDAGAIDSAKTGGDGDPSGQVIGETGSVGQRDEGR